MADISSLAIGCSHYKVCNCRRQLQAFKVRIVCKRIYAAGLGAGGRRGAGQGRLLHPGEDHHRGQGQGAAPRAREARQARIQQDGHGRALARRLGGIQ